MRKNELILELKKTFVQNAACPIQIGYINDIGELANITADLGIIITITSGNAIFVENSEGLFILPYSLGTIIVKIQATTVTSQVSLWCCTQVYTPTISYLTNLVAAYLPPNCYTTDPNDPVFARNYATALVFNELSYNLQTLFLDIFPPNTTNTNWENEIDDIYPWRDSFDYGLVVQTVNNIGLFDGSVYSASFLISKYIYARLGLEIYVYIKENSGGLNQYWILDYSLLSINTILGDSSGAGSEIIIYLMTTALTSTFLGELANYVNKIISPNILYTITQVADFDAFGLTIEVGDVYQQDPRLFVPFGLKYHVGAVYDAQAICSPFNPYFLLSFVTGPPSGNYSSDDLFITLTATATYDFMGIIYTQDVTNETFFSSSDPTVLFITDNNIANILDLGSSTITGNYAQNQDIQVYSIIEPDNWILDFSLLSESTILS